jgi:hypothetical protein
MHIVQFDKTMLEGLLSGMTIPGQTITYSRIEDARRASAFFCKVERENDFIRDAGTGNRFTVSNVRVCDV